MENYIKIYKCFLNEESEYFLDEDELFAYVCISAYNLKKFYTSYTRIVQILKQKEYKIENHRSSKEKIQKGIIGLKNKNIINIIEDKKNRDYLLINNIYSDNIYINININIIQKINNNLHNIRKLIYMYILLSVNIYNNWCEKDNIKNKNMFNYRTVDSHFNILEKNKIIKKNINNEKQYTLYDDIDLYNLNNNNNFNNGIIYFISDTKYIKIGVTNNVEKRLKELQTGNPKKLKVIKIIYCENPYYVEKMYHELFKSKRKEGEWFDILDIVKEL